MSVDPVAMYSPLIANNPEPTRGDPHQAAAEFEKMMISQLLNQIPIPGMEGTQAGAFLSMVHDALAEQLVRSGGLGLAAEIEQAMRGRPAPADAVAPTPRQTSGFGYRADPIDHTRRFHDGIDLAAPAGSEIRVQRDGVVSFAGRRGGYGNLVVVDHGDGLETRYGHCATLAVQPGDALRAGDALGTVGSTGRSTGPHVHFEVRQDGIPVDPNSDDWGAKAIDATIRGEEQRQRGASPEGSP